MRPAQSRRQVIFSFGFRPFFIAAGTAAVVLVVLWLAMLEGGGAVVMVVDPLGWHIHEMVYGFIGAALAGFLLTAIASWTGRSPVQGPELTGLVVAWLLGRVAMALSGGLPPLVTAALDLLFPFLLVAMVVREVTSVGNRRNYPVAAILAVWAIANLLYHLGANGAVSVAGIVWLTLSVHAVLALMTVIGGRVIPAFTRNWLVSTGASRLPVSRPVIEAAVLPLMLAAGACDALLGGTSLAGGLALLAGAVHAFRLLGWRGWLTLREPLVWVLHLAYAWLALGYLLLGASALGDWVQRSTALHALTIGAAGTMILAIMTRAALGHTGRPLRASRAAVLAYTMIAIAALLRMGAAQFAALQHSLMLISAAAWTLGFGAFLMAYWRILVNPRIDAQSGESLR